MYDITLTPLGGSATGLMLARGRDGRPLWRVRAGRTLPVQLSVGEYTYAQFPPQYALPWPESNWQHGIGGVDSTDANKLAQGYKIDGSVRGKLQLARALQASTVDDAPAQYVPSGFCRSGTQMWAFIGDYAYSWDFTNKNWDRGTRYGASAYYTGPRMFRNGVEFDGSVYVPSWADDVGSGGSWVSSDEPYKYMYKTVDATSWTEKAVSTTHPAYCKFLTVANSKLVMGYIGDAVARTTLSTSIIYESTTSFYVNSTANLAPGDVIEISDAAGDDLALITDVGSYLTVVRGYRGSIAHSHSAGASINEVVLNKHQIRTSTDGTTWSSPINVGDATSPITGMLGLDWGASSYVYIFKTDGIYKYDFSDVNKLSDIGGPTNGRASCVWNGYVYFSKNGGGLYQLDPDVDVITDVSFNIVMPHLTHLHGEVVALAAEADAIYALVLDSANSKYHLLQGFNVSDNPHISWHHVGAIAYTTATDANHAALCVDTVPNGAQTRQRIQVGVESTGSNLLPYHFYRDADQDDVFSPDDDSYAITIKQDKGLPSVEKRWDKLTVTTGNLGAGANDHYIEVQYRIDGGAWSWFTNTRGGTASQANSKLTSDTATLYFPEGVSGYACELKWLFYQGTTTTTSPELHDFVVTAQLRTDAPNTIPLVLDVRDGVRLLNGCHENAASTILANLQSWAAQADELTLVDIEGNQRTVLLLPESYQEIMVRQPGPFHRAGYVVQVMAVELP